MRPKMLLRIRAFLIALTLAGIFLAPPPALAQAAQGPEVDIYDDRAVGVCHRQPALSDKELKRAVAVMRAIVEGGGRLSPEEEEALIQAQNLGSDRLNCLMGKLMAANDIFGWGGPENYGVPLTDKERRTASKYREASLMLKRYMEEVLNLTAETQ